VGRHGLNVSGSEWGPLAGFCEHGNELQGSIKRWGISLLYK